jgi:hypothetical protein
VDKKEEVRAVDFEIRLCDGMCPQGNPCGLSADHTGYTGHQCLKMSCSTCGIPPYNGGQS